MLSIDFETRSRKDISFGTSAYFADVSTEVLCAAWAIGNAPVAIWRPGMPCPEPIRAHIESGGLVCGWNVNFERRCIETRMNPVHGWPLPRLDQYRDTAAWAAAMALPRDLEDAAIMLNLAQRKDQEGHKLMLRMSKPGRGGEWVDGPELRERLEQYCAQDVETERAVRRKLRRPIQSEQELWRLDQVINDRGIAIDVPLVEDMLRIVATASDFLNAELADITNSAVTRVTSLPAIKIFLKDSGVPIERMRKEDFPALIAVTTGRARRVVEIRQEAAKSSNAKLQAALEAVGADGRVRDLFLFHGAHTGRWSGKNIQPQNFPRGSGIVKDSDLAIPFLRSGKASLIDFVYGRPLGAVSDCLRGIFIPAPGKKFVVGDFSSIEARVTAWIAGEQWKLDAFADGRDLYKTAASQIYRCSEGVIGDKDPRRQVGKTAELALGFGGGVNALAQMGRNYGIDFAPTLGGLLDVASDERRKKVEERYEETLKRGNAKLPRDAWMACELIKRGWREANPAIASSWHAVDNAAWEAVASRGERFDACRVSFIRENGFLWMTLPSGRELAYANPRVESIEPPWSDKSLTPPKREKQTAVTVASGAPGKRHLMREALWPGLTVQASVQAIARDLLAHGMTTLEAAGYPIVMHSHDEAVAEHVAPDADEFCELLCQPPDWADGLPYSAKGWVGDRYRKD